jgi:hypothetical protein
VLREDNDLPDPPHRVVLLNRPLSRHVMIAIHVLARPVSCPRGGARQ